MSSDNNINDCNEDDSHVELGFVEEPENPCLLDSHYFPSKIGGKPSWLSFKPLPSSNLLKCSNCNQPLCFLLQIYAPDNGKNIAAFHRSIFVFVCRNGQCSEINSSKNFVALRCQLPRYNEFYGEYPIKSDEDAEKAKKVQDFSKICAYCGSPGDKQCAKCKVAAYCDRSHQVAHWKMIHKNQCCSGITTTTTGAKAANNNYSTVENGQNNNLNSNSNSNNNDSDSSTKSEKKSGTIITTTTTTVAKNDFLFPEFELIIEREEIVLPNEKSSKSIKAGEKFIIGGEKSEEQKMLEYEAFLRENNGMLLLDSAKQNGQTKVDNNNLDDLELFENPNKKDKTFKKFSKRVEQNPEQVLRYDRNGYPLWATDYTPENVGESIPDCQFCGAPRSFEFQIMPQLLSRLGVDDVGKSIDWATVAIYTCSESCKVENFGYATEFVWKQDFCE